MGDKFGTQYVACTCGVREELSYRNFGRNIRIRVIPQVLANRLIQGKPSILRQLRDGDRREHLAHGGDVEFRINRVRYPSAPIRISVRSSQKRLASLRDHYGAR